MIIIKRDGTKQEFNFNKIKSAVDKAFKATGRTGAPNIFFENLEHWFNLMNAGVEEITVEKVQDIVEKQLMYEKHFEVAKEYILYREKHKEQREHAQKDIEFIHNFVKSNNVANATIDDNANVGNQNIAVLNAEIHKEDNKDSNLEIWARKVEEMYPELTRKQMLMDCDTILYVHDLSSQILMPYCAAVSMYPFLLNGLATLGGKSATPKSLESFCGIYINLIFALASEVKGAVGTSEVLMYFSYFCEKEWGLDYYKKYDNVITSDICNKKKTIREQIHQYFQQITYSINQVASSRGAQSPFTNFAFFDKYFFEGMFGEFCFPDGTKPHWEAVNWLQQEYLHWLNRERLKCMLTFPVCAYSCLTENGEFKDLETKDFICQEYSEGNSFFLYTSETVDSLSQCCRLRSAVEENTFSYTNGMVGVQTGSKNVITLNLNRIIQDWTKTFVHPDDWCQKECDGLWADRNKAHVRGIEEELKQYLINILDRVYKYQTAYNELLHWACDNNLYMAYKAGFIDLDKQYLTLGVSGLNQSAEFLGITCNNNPDYQEYCKFIFSTIKEQNTLHRTKRTRFNTELVPKLCGHSKSLLIDLKLL